MCGSSAVADVTVTAPGPHTVVVDPYHTSIGTADVTLTYLP